MTLPIRAAPARPDLTGEKRENRAYRKAGIGYGRRQARRGRFPCSSA